MVFSSYLFIFYFLPVSLLLYYGIPSRRGRHLFLTLTSFVFYGWANPKFSGLMLFTITVDYLAGRVQAHNGWRNWNDTIYLLTPEGHRTRTQKLALTAAVCSNLGLLGFFKYFNFAVDNYHAAAGAMGITTFDNALRIALPLGISFYTFQAMSYAVDVYRGHTLAMRSFIDYACFVSMYQQLVAGPIVRFSEVADQLRAHTHTVDKFARGVALFSCGLAMKVLLANPCGKIADTVFNAGPVPAVDAWYGLLAYAFQIFFDFAAYSEMAVGLGLMMGWVFAKNFETPYKSQSMTEFWRRWHISLSTWLRDYLYISIGGNRKGPSRTYINLMITMLLGGLWHGASWNYLIWGGLHGAMLAVERKLGGALWRNWPVPLRVAATFGTVLLAWVFFRSANLATAFVFLASLAGAAPIQNGAALVGGIIYQPYYMGSLIVAGIVAWCCPSAWNWTQRLPAWKAAACLLLLWVSLLMLLTQAYNPFIYFIF